MASRAVDWLQQGSRLLRSASSLWRQRRTKKQAGEKATKGGRSKHPVSSPSQAVLGFYLFFFDIIVIIITDSISISSGCCKLSVSPSCPSVCLSVCLCVRCQPVSASPSTPLPLPVRTNYQKNIQYQPPQLLRICNQAALRRSTSSKAPASQDPTFFLPRPLAACCLLLLCLLPAPSLGLAVLAVLLALLRSSVSSLLPACRCLLHQKPSLSRRSSRALQISARLPALPAGPLPSLLLLLRLEPGRSS